MPLRCAPAPVTPDSLLRLERWLAALSGTKKSDTLSALAAQLQLVANRRGVSPLQLPPHLFHAAPRDDVVGAIFPPAQERPVDALRAEMLSLQRLNMLVVRNFPALQLSGAKEGDAKERLVALVLRHRAVIFEGVKLMLLWRALGRTKIDGRPPTLLFNRIRARAAAKMLDRESEDGGEKKNRDSTMFEQAFRHLGSASPAAFRRDEHAWEAKFVGEGGEGVGLYRICISQMCSELQHSGAEDLATCLLPLLVPTDNHRLDTGIHRECWTVNPSATGATNEKMLRFFGRLLGLAVRSKVRVHFFC